MAKIRLLLFTCFCICSSGLYSLSAQINSSYVLDVGSDAALALPENSTGKPAAGKRVAVTPKEYAGTNVCHMLYLPENWDKNWKKNKERIPIIFEYTGNYYPASGSTGEVEDAALGYTLSGGKYIWVSLPYISEDGKNNEVTWWGDETATVNYAKKYVPEIIEAYGGDKDAVFLCGFSRGAIGVNYLGLYDDEVAKLWSAFITHDHFDGIKEWGGVWGKPLVKYREQAAERLSRVNDRPYLVIQNGKEYGTKEWVSSTLNYIDNFKFIQINTNDIFGSFPNEIAKHKHTDRWPLLASTYRSETWRWFNKVIEKDAARISCQNLDLVPKNKKELFKDLQNTEWQEVFFDSCTKDWEEKWFLDGKKATISNSKKGMDFFAGKVRKENASHSVLWTKESFEGDIRIDYEYTKLDDIIEAVTIIYIQATGSGADGFDSDITKWADKREVPKMSMYFNNMNTYHISYAAFDIPNANPENDYIRARRYIPGEAGLNNTDFGPDRFKTNLLKNDESCKVTIIKKSDDLFLYIRSNTQELLCHWDTSSAPPISEGRIGLRHMWTRAARYQNFIISKLGK